MNKNTNAQLRLALESNQRFDGFSGAYGQTVYCPNQFFDRVLRNESRAVCRVVGYVLMRSVDNASPHAPIGIPYSVLIEKAGVSRGAVREAIDTAIARGYLRCIRKGVRHRQGECGECERVALAWSDTYAQDEEIFEGFYAGPGHRTRVPRAFFEQVLPHEPLALIKTIGAITRFSVGYEGFAGERRRAVALSYRDLQRHTGITSNRLMSEGLQLATERGFIQCVAKGCFDYVTGGVQSKKAVYQLHWRSIPSWVERAGVEEEFPARPGQVEEALAVQASTVDALEQSEIGVGSVVIGSKRGAVDGSKNTPTVQKGGRFEAVDNLEAFKKECGEASKKGGGNGSEKGAGKRSKRGAIIQTIENKEPKPTTTTPPTHESLPTPEASIAQTDFVVVAGGEDGQWQLPEAQALRQALDRMTALTLTAACARSLLVRYGLDEVTRQLEWLPLRKAANPAGMLRRAIEQRWSAPVDVHTGGGEEEGAAAAGQSAAADPNSGIGLQVSRSGHVPAAPGSQETPRALAQAFYAAQHRTARSVVVPHKGDLAAAERLLAAAQGDDGANPPDPVKLGQALGERARRSPQAAEQTMSLCSAAFRFGDQVLSQIAKTCESPAQDQGVQERPKIRAATGEVDGAYLSYLRSCKARLGVEAADRMAAFEAARAREEASLSQMVARKPLRVLLDHGFSEGAYLQAFALAFKDKVLGPEAWRAQQRSADEGLGAVDVEDLVQVPGEAETDRKSPALERSWAGMFPLRDAITRPASGARI